MGEPGTSADGPDSAESTPTAPMDAVGGDGEPRGPQLLGSSSFFRLWLAQVASSLGDWIGLAAILALATRVGGASPEAAVGIVMSARLIPGFFLASVGGVLVDRWDRKRVMIACDVGRGVVMGFLPLVDSVLGLFVASLLLEVLTLLWSPAKEASVPNLVSIDRLASANSLSLAAAYGTFPVGSAIFAGLAKVADLLGRHDALDFLRLNQESLAIYADMLTFFVSAALISSLTLPRRTPAKRSQRIDLGRTFTEVKEGWSYISSSPLVRAVMIGLGTGLIGGGMVAPLGPVFARDVLQAGPAGFGLMLTALGLGAAVGIVGVTVLQRRLPHQALFAPAVLVAGGAMMAAASMSSLGPTMAFIALMGVSAGAVYVLGFTILQECVDDDLRGRIFAAFYTLSRLCLLLALAVAPLLSSALDKLSERLVDGQVSAGGLTVSLPGVRLTLWIGAAITLVAGTVALWTIRASAADRAGRRDSQSLTDGTEPA
ncbi:MAG TPA: MFS transporter [Acidimicrobiales bacterium]|nr:MFS transporter [Acidimicrobiales bacterium]